MCNRSRSQSLSVWYCELICKKLLVRKKKKGFLTADRITAVCLYSPQCLQSIEAFLNQTNKIFSHWILPCLIGDGDNCHSHSGEMMRIQIVAGRAEGVRNDCYR